MVERSVRSACDRGSKAPVSMTSHRMGDQNLLSRAPPCFGRHVKPGRTSGRWPVVKIIAESLSHDEKHVVPTPLSGLRVGGREP
jgi:hypothetical protein